MAALDQHPTVRAARRQLPLAGPPRPLDPAWLRDLCLAAGADDVGFVALDRPEVADQRADVLRAFPAARALVSLVVRMNREPIRGVNRSVANLEFHAATDHANAVARAVVRQLEDAGVAAYNPPAGFPMEMDHFPGKVWVVSHKPVAIAAGLGQMGLHRNVIHPRFGSFILLDTIVLAADVAAEGRPIDYNPCLTCKLCVAACPVGAIGSDGHFNFSSCMTHNYREFMGGFTDWVGTVADSPSGQAYRRVVGDGETASLWQSLAFGPNYKAAYCLAVCPAGEDVIGPFLGDRGAFVRDTVKPLQEKAETLYVVPGSDAEGHAARRFPHKRRRAVGGLRPASIAGFLFALPHVFQRDASAGLAATYHFTFTGAEPAKATVTIRDKQIAVDPAGHVGTADVAVTADSRAWLRVLAKDASMVWSIIRRRVRVKGPLRLLVAFGKCFPS